MLEVKNLRVKVGNREVIRGLDLSVDKGIYVLMGPNGVGKTTLSRAIIGDPELEISGDIFLDAEEITRMSPEERFLRGLYYGFQIPPEIKGLRFRTLIEKVLDKLGRNDDITRIDEIAKELGVTGLLDRDVNSGFSGGERKKMEMLQMLLFKPRYAVLDEPDSGVDVDTVRKIGEILNRCKDECGMLIITHTGNLIKYTEPDKVFIMVNGRIVKTGDKELIKEIEERGYSMVIG